MEFQMRNKTFISSMVGIAAALAVAGSAGAATSFTFDSWTANREAGAVSVWTFGPTFNTPDPTSLLLKSATGDATGLWTNYYAEVHGIGSDVIATSTSIQFAVGSDPEAFAGLSLSKNAGANLLGVTDFQFNVTAYTGDATRWYIIATDFSGRSLISGPVLTSGTGQKTFALSSFSQVEGTGFDWSKVREMNFGVIPPTVVPAPGALALLGVAGLVGARRRRA
jgi:MYXO-CTERM domain-containing protein